MGYKFRELSTKEFQKVLESAHFSSENFLQSLEMYQRYQNQGKEAYLIGLESDSISLSEPKSTGSESKSTESELKSESKSTKSDHKDYEQSMPKIVACGLLAARPWHFGKKIFKIAGGPLLDYDAPLSGEILAKFTAGARDFVAQKDAIALEISPNIISEPRNIENQVLPGSNHLYIRQKLLELGYKYLGEYEQAKWLFVLNLHGKTEQGIWDSLRVTHRRMLRKATREGVKIREMTPDELPLMKEILAETGSRQGFSDPDLEYYRSMKQAFGEKVKFMLAEREINPNPLEKGSLGEGSLGESSLKNCPKTAQNQPKTEPLAVAMYIIDNREMIYLYGGSRRAGQKYAGSYLMQWEMIKQALKMGIPRYNFYGTKPIPGNGVYQFKQGFRGTMEELLGTFALPIGWLGKIYVNRLKTREIGELR